MAFQFTSKNSLHAHSFNLKLFLGLSITFYYLLVVALFLYFSERLIILLLLIPPVNLIILLCFGRFVASSILFPYANCCLKRLIDRDTNAGFGKDFVQILQQMEKSLIKMLQRPLEELNEEKAMEINQDLLRATGLVRTYVEVNDMCRQDGKTDAVRELYPMTDCLEKIKKVLQGMGVSVEMMLNQSTGHPSNSSLSFEMSLWELYSQEFDSEAESLFRRLDFLILPHFTQGAFQVQEQIKELSQLIQNFNRIVETAVLPMSWCCAKKKRTSCFCCFKHILGRLDQQGYLLERNYQGQHFMIDSITERGVKIDSMFFPGSPTKLDRLSHYKDDPDYLKLPTIILCNPNALFYQYMVTSPNSYWLNLFLSMNMNIMVWNYRGYGLTKGSPNPYNLKTDAEQVLHFLLTQIKVKGKIGVYGRSLGGVAANHLASTYPHIISLLVADRTFGNIKEVAINRLSGSKAFLEALYVMATMKWEAFNDMNFLKAKCYKIITADPKDEIVEIQGSLPILVAREACLDHLPKQLWDAEQIATLYESLRFIYYLEFKIYSSSQNGYDLRKKSTFGRLQQQQPLNKEDFKLQVSTEYSQSEYRASLYERETMTSYANTYRKDSIFKEPLIAQRMGQTKIKLKIDTAHLEKIKRENFKDLVKCIQCLVLFLNDLRGGIMKMSDVSFLMNFTQQNQTRQIHMLELLLQNMLAYGTLRDDLDLMIKQTHNERKLLAINELRNVVNVSEQLLDILSASQLGNELQEQIQAACLNIRNFFQGLYSFIQWIVDQNHLSEDLIGKLLPFNTGHKCSPNRTEEQLLKNLIQQSGFLDKENTTSGNLRQHSIQQETQVNNSQSMSDDTIKAKLMFPQIFETEPQRQTDYRSTQIFKFQNGVDDWPLETEVPPQEDGGLENNYLPSRLGLDDLNKSTKLSNLSRLQNKASTKSDWANMRIYRIDHKSSLIRQSTFKSHSFIEGDQISNDERMILNDHVNILAKNTFSMLIKDEKFITEPKNSSFGRESPKWQSAFLRNGTGNSFNKSMSLNNEEIIVRKHEDFQFE